MPIIHIDIEALRRDLATLNLEHECDCANRIGFEAWMRLRTNRSHAEFMARTMRLPSAS
jgi:hypothetical protein